MNSFFCKYISRILDLFSPKAVEMKNQKQEELEVFKKFIKKTCYVIKLASIKQYDPPIPDIIAETIDGKQVNFELTRIVDSNISRKLYDAVELTHKLHKTKSEQTVRLSNLKNFNICVHFEDMVSKNRKVQFLPELLKFLDSLELHFEGDSYKADLPHGMGYVRFFKSSGCSIEVAPNPTWFSYPTESIENKLLREQTYEFDSGNLELLAYLLLQPEVQNEVWLKEAEAKTHEHIQESQFQAVWIYSYPSNEVLLHIECDCAT